MHFLRSILSAVLAAVTVLTAVRSAENRPNVVLIMTDDQGSGDLGINGNPVLETPHIDALARAGATLTNFYVSPVCAPTRASLMTGRYNYRTRVVDTFKGRSMMEPDEMTVAEVLRSAGYATGIFGKWHLGDNYPMRATDQGFEEAITLRGGGLAQPSDPIENRRRYTNPIVFHNNQQVQARGYCTNVFFDGALAFIDQAQRAGRPFFAYIAPNAPHAPLHDVPPELYAKYKAKNLSAVLIKPGNDADMVARVYAMEENIDQNVGRLMAHLEANGLLTNTLVIFMCDNGPDGARFVGRMRGRKTEVLDGGIRSPFFVHWPARLKAGTASDRIAAHIDVMPTLLAAARVPVPPGLKLDGRSLLPLLEGAQAEWPDRALVLQTHRGDVPVAAHNMAVRTQRWKLVHPSGFGRDTAPADAPFELYDVVADPLERNNLAGQQPAKLDELRSFYDRWFADVASTRPNNFAPPRIVIGSDKSTTTFLSPQEWRVPVVGDNGREGRWLLHSEREAAYSVEFRWLAAIAPGTLEVTAGEATRSVEVPAVTERVTIDRLTLPAGDFDFSAVVRHGQTRDGVYHVILTRL